MHIDRIDLFHVAMPLIYPWKTAYGEDAAIHSVLCRMTSGSVHGWGESAPFAAPCYSPEWAGGIFAVNRDWLAPAVIGKDIGSGEELQRLLALYKGNPFAKAVLDTAWWSLHSRIEGQPLHELLAKASGHIPGISENPWDVGVARDEIPVGADFGVMDSLDDLLEAVGRAVDEGFPRIKLKFRPGWDVPMLAAVRKQHPDFPFHIDCNSGYRIADVPLFQEIDRFHLEMIEQPLQHDDLIDHAALQRQIGTAVCLDESITTPRQVEQAIAMESCRYVNVKPGRVGGLTNAVAIHNICATGATSQGFPKIPGMLPERVPCWVGGMLESAVGASLCVALGMLPNFTYPGDIFPSSRFYHEDLADPPIELHPNAAGVPSVRAMAALPEPVPQRLERCCVQRAAIGKP